MRDYVLFYVNGRRCQVRGETVFSSLSEFLRSDLYLPGTKVVCAEGDCGACTVLVGRIEGQRLRYETVDSCIQFLYQLDGKHVVTVEGLAGNGRLHPVQQALVDHHGSQCGFCTPGFVMALAGLCEEKANTDLDSLKIGLTGNLCRCTGYLPILEAGLAIDPASVAPLAERYTTPALVDDLREHALSPVLIQSDGPPGAGPWRFFGPRSLEDALAFKARHPEAVIVSGATELGVLRNKGGWQPRTLLSLAGVPGLDSLDRADGTLVVGANVTWRQVEAFAREELPELYRLILRFGSPQIRNVATVVGNVAHGSPIADSLPFLLVMDAEVELAGVGGRRVIKLDGFYRGYKVKDLAPDEIITRVFVPLPAADEVLKLYKVSRRRDLDIATVGAAVRLKRAGDVITRAFVALSGVAPTVVRLPGTEAFLQGKLFTEETFREAGRRARAEVEPISDVRGARDFRLRLAENLLVKCYHDSVTSEFPNQTNHESHESHE
jgi:xanthine dehydrogenase small subunit